MVVYKLRHKETGLFFSQLNSNYYSLGDGTAKWNKTGKTFNSTQPILHLKQQLELHKQPDPQLVELLKCEIVKYEIKEVETINL